MESWTNAKRYVSTTTTITTTKIAKGFHGFEAFETFQRFRLDGIPLLPRELWESVSKVVLDCRALFD